MVRLEFDPVAGGRERRVDTKRTLAFIGRNSLERRKYPTRLWIRRKQHTTIQISGRVSSIGARGPRATAWIVEIRSQRVNMASKIVHEKPRICLIDVEDDVSKTLKAANFNCYNGSLGSSVNVRKPDKHSTHFLKPDFDF